MARRYQHSLQEIKTMILQSAENIVIEEGYSALNARKIAMAIDYTVGSIYMVFDGMADIALHINAQTVNEMTAYLQNHQTENLDTALENLATNYFDFANQNFNKWRMLFEFAPPKNKLLPNWYQQHLDTGFNTIASLVTQALPQHLTIDRTLAIQIVWSGIHGIYTLSVANKLGGINSQYRESSALLLVRSFINDLSQKNTEVK